MYTRNTISSLLRIDQAIKRSVPERRDQERRQGIIDM